MSDREELDSVNRMLLDACSDLGAIHEALGLDHEEAGGAAPILEAIEHMRAALSLAKDTFLMNRIDVPRVLEKIDEALSGQSDVHVTIVPEGWKLVPVEPTETMVVCGFESWPSEYFSSQEEWEEFEKMSGCRQAFHKAQLCYRAMLDAAPHVGVGAA